MNGLEGRRLGQPAQRQRERVPRSAPARAERSPWMVRSLARTYAQRRLEREVRAIAVDLLGRCQADDLPDDCAEWFANTVDDAVTRVCDSSLTALADTLDARLAAAPSWIARRLREAEARHDAGCV